MQTALAIFQAIFSLVWQTGYAFWRIALQAGEFAAATFAGVGGVWLAAGICLLAAAAGIQARLPRAPQRGDRCDSVRGGAYFIALGLIAGAVAVLWTGYWNTGYTVPRQFALCVVLTVVVGLHLAWFAGDLLCWRTGWARGGRFFRRIRENRTAYYMILPTLVFLGLFLYTPAITIFYYSFYSYDMGGAQEWIGLGNYERLFGEEVFWKSAKNMAILTVFSVSLTLAVPLFVAELIFHLRTEKWRYYLRAAFLIPMVVPGVIIFLIWGYFYSDAGLIPLFGHAIGLGDRFEGLLSRPNTALYALIFVGFPFVMGINLLIFYAGLGNIDESVWEAAKLDGAGVWKRFIRIDLPLLLRQFKLLLILGIIGGVQAFENVLVMTQGGPGWQTMLPGLYMYRSAMSFSEYGFACAVGVILFLFVLTLSLIVNRGFPGSRT